MESSREPWWLPLLGGGTKPLFLVSDVAALAGAAYITSAQPLLAVMFAATVLLAAAGSGLYRSRLYLSTLEAMPRLLRAWLIATSLMVIAAQLLFTKFIGLYLAGYALLLLIAFRLLASLLVRTLRSWGIVAHPTVIVGADESGRTIAEKIVSSPQYGLRMLGFLDDQQAVRGDLPAPMLGGPDDLEDVLARHQPRALVIAQSYLSEDQLVSMIRDCHRHRCELFVLPRLYEISNMGEDTDFLAGMPLVRLRRRAYRSWAWHVKRVLDIVLSGLALIVLAPLLAVIAIVVRLDGGPGVLFRQERVSVDGRRFQVLKFRSMRPANEKESQTQWNIANDRRLSAVGKFLRQTSLDELPQLWNILRGDMSIVGPRPERPYFVAEFERLYGGYRARHRVRCGLTGWAQVHGLRGDTSIAERAHYDNFYIENWSLWLDLKIMLMTVTAVFSKPGA